MSESDVSGSRKPTQPQPTQPHRNQPPWQAQLAFAMVLAVVLIILVIVMLKSAKASSAEWQNLVYVFGSVEALVFTAIGWVFGRRQGAACGCSRRTVRLVASGRELEHRVPGHAVVE